MEKLSVSPRTRKPDRNGSTQLRSRPPRHRHDLIGQQQSFIQIVRDHDRSGRVPRFRTQLRKHLLQSCPRQRIERAERFVQKQNARARLRRLARSQRAAACRLRAGRAASAERRRDPRFRDNAWPVRSAAFAANPETQPEQRDGRFPERKTTAAASSSEKRPRRGGECLERSHPRRSPCRNLARRSPARILINVDLPEPVEPTIETNSPSSTERLTPLKTSRTFPAEAKTSKHFELQQMPMSAPPCWRVRLDRTQPHLHKTHHSVEQESDDSDRQDAQQNVGVNQAVVLLPQEAADSGRAREHLAGDDDQPRDSETQAISREHVRQRCRQQHLRECLEPGKTQNLRDVPIFLRNRFARRPSC